VLRPRDGEILEAIHRKPLLKQVHLALLRGHPDTMRHTGEPLALWRSEHVAQVVRSQRQEAAVVHERIPGFGRPAPGSELGHGGAAGRQNVILEN
jgi:hypothetical protein